MSSHPSVRPSVRPSVSSTHLAYSSSRPTLTVFSVPGLCRPQKGLLFHRAMVVDCRLLGLPLTDGRVLYQSEEASSRLRTQGMCPALRVGPLCYSHAWLPCFCFFLRLSCFPLHHGSTCALVQSQDAALPFLWQHSWAEVLLPSTPVSPSPGLAGR